MTALDPNILNSLALSQNTQNISLNESSHLDPQVLQDIHFSPSIDANPTVLALLRQGNTLTSDQLRALTRDEYNFHFHKDQFELEHGVEATQNLENQVQAQTDYQNGFNVDNRSIPRQVGDWALGLGQGAVQGVLGAAALVTSPLSDVSTGLSKLSDYITNKSSEYLG